MSKWATPNFTFAELRCKGCDGSCSFSQDEEPLFHLEEDALWKLQEMRKLIGKPFSPNSACRCPLHNARVGGAPRSQHRCTKDDPSTAIDIPLFVSKQTIVEAAEEVGFMGIGTSYKTFVHVDNRPRKARW